MARFCFLTTFYPPFNFGGDGIGIQRFARGLARRGHEVTVVHDVDAFQVLHSGPEPAPSSSEPGIRTVGLRSGVGALSPFLTQQLGRPVWNGRKIRRILDEGRFDVINFHNVSLVGGPGLFKYGEATKIYMAHEHWLVCPTHVLWRHGRERCTEKQCFRCVLRHRRPPQLWRATGFLQRQLHHVDAFIAMSEFSRAKHREFGFPREMEVVPYFLEDLDSSSATMPKSSSPHPRPYVLFVGRLERIKGLDDVLPMFRNDLGVDFLIAGDGDHRAALEGIAQGNERIRFLGRVTPEALRPLYDHALALIVPSVCFETFGIILIEAFRQGTPVIARRLGPFPEIVEPSGAGFLFDTEEELLGALRRLVNEPDLRARLGAKGREAFQSRYSESAVLPRYLDVVERAKVARQRS